MPCKTGIFGKPPTKIKNLADNKNRPHNLAPKQKKQQTAPNFYFSPPKHKEIPAYWDPAGHSALDTIAAEKAAARVACTDAGDASDSADPLRGVR